MGNLPRGLEEPLHRARPPIFIGLLVTWVSHDPALVLFFAYIATLWFGCGNAAQEIVKELPMFRRERLIGVEDMRTCSRSSCRLFA